MELFTFVIGNVFPIEGVDTKIKSSHKAIASRAPVCVDSDIGSDRRGSEIGNLDHSSDEIEIPLSRQDGMRYQQDMVCKSDDTHHPDCT